jgi:hypothetical protein
MKNLLLVLITCTVACTMPSCKREVATIKYDLDSVLPLNTHDLFKKVDVVLFDSIPDQPITVFMKMDHLDSLFYIQDYGRVNVLVYDEDGKFVRTIGYKGRGPGELEDLRDFQINRFTGNIELLGNMSPSIMIYDKEGNFIGKRNIGDRFITIDKFYHINSDLTAWLALAEDYKISVYSEKQNQVVHEFFLGMDKAYLTSFHYMKPFSHYADNTYFFDTYANTLYRFNFDLLEFEVYKRFDFGKYNFDKSLLPAPQEWERMHFGQRMDFEDKLPKGLVHSDMYIENDIYTLMTKWDYSIFTQKKDNSVLLFNSFENNINYFLLNMNNRFSYRELRLNNLSNVLNESLVGKEVYQKLEALRIEDENEERRGIIRYWFK